MVALSFLLFFSLSSCNEDVPQVEEGVTSCSYMESKQEDPSDTSKPVKQILKRDTCFRVIPNAFVSACIPPLIPTDGLYLVTNKQEMNILLLKLDSFCNGEHLFLDVGYEIIEPNFENEDMLLYHIQTEKLLSQPAILSTDSLIYFPENDSLVYITHVSRCMNCRVLNPTFFKTAIIPKIKESTKVDFKIKFISEN